MDMDLNNRLTEDETLEQAYDIFARVLLCREKDHKLCHILWRE